MSRPEKAFSWTIREKAEQFEGKNVKVTGVLVDIANKIVHVINIELA
jgi:hypothetical protein